MRVLVTNDDGIEALGLHVLAGALAASGLDVVVAAPQVDMSGSGAAIGRLHVDQHIDVSQVDLPHAPGVPAYGIDGPPALCVIAARLGGFGDPPDLVVSGINPGNNTGRSTLHSGTVGAALTAANFGVSAVAVSIDDGDEHQWDSAATVAVEATRWLASAADRTVLNINVPNLPIEALHGVRWARLAPFGTVRAAIAEARDGRLQMELRASGVELPADTDTALVEAGFVAVTSITGIRAAEPSDVAEHLERVLVAGAA